MTTPNVIAWMPGERDRIAADYPEFDWDRLAETTPASQDAVNYVLAQPVDDDDGRSDWRWVRLVNGDLMLAVFPHGDTYFATEGDHS